MLRTGRQSSVTLRTVLCFWLLALLLALPEGAVALQNSATGTAGGALLDISGATVTLLKARSAVTVAEITPGTAVTKSTASPFVVTLLPTIVPGDSGIGVIALTAPAGYSGMTITGVTVGGVAQLPTGTLPGSGSYRAISSGQTTTISLGSVVTASLTPVAVSFTVTTPTTSGKADFSAAFGTNLITASAVAGNADGNAVNGNDMTVVVQELDLANSTLTVSPTIIKADGIASGTITALLRYGINQPLSGITLSFSSDRGGIDVISQPVAPTDSSGKSSGTISSALPGVATLTATLADGTALTSKAQVTFTQGLVLQLAKSANKKEVNIGDVVTYQIQLRNRTTRDVQQVHVVDQLPPNFKYLAGSSYLNGVKSADPSGNRTLIFPIGTVPALLDRNGNGTADPGEPGYATFSYQLVVGSGATPREYLNTAVARDVCETCLVSNSDQARVSVVVDPLFDLGTIIGKVFEDKNRDGFQDQGENGVANVMVALDDGTYALTDPHGRYHFPAVRPGQRLVKINSNTLPPGAEITTREALVVSVTSGLLAKANFGVVLHYDQQSIGRQGESGVLLTGAEQKKPVELRGDVETPALLVNGDQVQLPTADIQLAGTEEEAVIEIGYLKKNAGEFLAYVTRPEQVSSWELTIFDDRSGRVKTLRGEGPTPAPIIWNGTHEDGTTVPGGEIYQYQLTARYGDGSSITSPRRSFGVNYTSAISVNLMGGAFRTGSAELTPQARKILKETATVMKRLTREKVVINGHTDGVGSDKYNMDLSRRRAEAAAEYFTKVENLPQERFVVRWFGKTQPAAGNETALGRELNRRVEIRGEFSETKRAATPEPYRTTTLATLNGTQLELDGDGRFSGELKDVDAAQLDVELTNVRGRTVKTSIPLPHIDIDHPKGTTLLSRENSSDAIKMLIPTGADWATFKGTAVSCGLTGRTDPGNSVELDGKPLAVATDGSFSGTLDLAAGENSFALLARNAEGFTRISTLSARLSDRDSSGKLLLTVAPVPNLTVQLPPKGIQLNDPRLIISGAADPGTSVRVNGQPLVVAADGTFTTAITLKTGRNSLRIEAIDQQGNVGFIERDLELSATRLFFLAFADGKIGQLNSKGFLKGAGTDSGSKLYNEGRLSYYLKGVIAGKYLITSAFDSGTNSFDKLFSNLDRSNNDRLLTNLDPDKFYPVYGDSSTVVFDAQSQGKFYLALDSDDLHLLVGNYPLNMTGTELAAYQRTLFGAHLTYQSPERSRYGQPNTTVEAFAAEVRQAHIRDELRATGGSLYYLSHKDVVEGSEQISIVVRDKNTGLQLSRLPQQQNVDYSIKYDQGRILFNRPISSVSADSMVISQALLSGNPVFLQVDYETRLDSFEKSAIGGRVRQQIGDHVSIGGTYIKDELQAGKYELNGADAEIRVGKNTRFTGEYASSSGSDAQTFTSVDGGLSYQNGSTSGDRSGSAWKLGADIDIGEWLGRPDRYRISGYLKRLQPGFMSNGTTSEQGTMKGGLTTSLLLTDRDKILARYDQEETDSTDPNSLKRSEIGTVQLTHDQGRWQLSTEYQSRQSQSVAGTSIEQTQYLAARFHLEVNKKLGTTLEQQLTLDGTRNDKSTLGLEYQVLPKLSLSAIGSQGTQGTAAQGGMALTLDKGKIYLQERLADNLAGKSYATVIGGEKPVGTSGKVYTEYQWERSDKGNRDISVVGAQQQWEISPGLKLLLSGEHGDIETKQVISSRYTIGAGISYSSGTGLTLSTRNEMRHESGSTRRIQYLTSNKMELKLNPVFTLIGKFRFSVTNDLNLKKDVAGFEERSIGLAYRPVVHDRFNALVRYTQLKEKLEKKLLELEGSDSASDVFSTDWSLELTRHLEWVGKEAYRIKREQVGSRPQTTTHTLLTVQRLNIRLFRNIDWGAEYRILAQREAADRKEGWLTELTWEPIKYFRLGGGYNFTTFSDDEFSSNNYSMYGWFIRVQGKY